MKYNMTMIKYTQLVDQLFRVSTEGCALVGAKQFTLAHALFGEARSLLVASSVKTAGPAATNWYVGTLTALDANTLIAHGHRNINAVGDKDMPAVTH
jgi:hypothetical protein